MAPIRACVISCTPAAITGTPTAFRIYFLECSYLHSSYLVRDTPPSLIEHLIHTYSSIFFFIWFIWYGSHIGIGTRSNCSSTASLPYLLNQLRVPVIHVNLT